MKCDANLIRMSCYYENLYNGDAVRKEKDAVKIFDYPFFEMILLIF